MKAILAKAPLSKASKYQMIIRESVEYADENSLAAVISGGQKEIGDHV